MAVAGTLLASAAPADAGPAAAASPPPLAAWVDHDRFFSPDGDGQHERATFVFALDARASVVMLVTDHSSQVVRRERLGVLDAGRHVWRWNGRGHGQTQPDGSYGVLLRASSGKRESRIGQSVQVVTEPDDGQVVLSRPTVYPAATVVPDRLLVVYLRETYSAYAAQYPQYYGEDIPLHTRLVVKAPDGTVVHSAKRGGYRPVFSWSARDTDGAPLAAGTYHLRLVVRDSVGNVRVIREPVAVSSAQLVEQVWTSTVAAADAAAAPYPLYDPGCNGCGETCGPVPSTRFPGGLSFQQPCSFGYAALGLFGASPPLTPAPVDSFRVTAVGGPTTPGDSDIASFAGATMGPGDVTVSTPWQPVELDDYPYLPDRTQPVTWSVSTDTENDYDIATFTVEYRSYVPAP